MTLQDIPRERRRYESNLVVKSKAGNAIESRHSFKHFRLTIRPGMKRAHAQQACCGSMKAKLNIGDMYWRRGRGC
jgi:hypothetical protein